MTETDKVEIRGEQYDLNVLRRMIERIEANATRSRDTAVELSGQAVQLMKDAHMDDEQANRYRKMLAIYEASK